MGGVSLWHWVVVAAYLSVFLAGVFYRAGVRNVAFNATGLDGGHRLVSRLGRSRVLWIAVSNVVVTVATLGLMRPWAAVRTWDYMVRHTALVPGGPLDAIVGAAGEAGNVASAEYLDLAGVDLGL
ncbi:YjgN family protein [Alsobacter sp. SYSU M60028]|uniref:YjgN family protein n=1 Tax=Alsobacter ponti TaxID=2962936 RepID=A0ABT1LKQ6_9HYPH|nr:DUF898 family protein [Alsobacter ponti]MCP8940833.1 YjgN family protein [Alsobacter ponti]